MARAGGTLFSKCLGCMDGVVLLSEIHPNSGNYINPLEQARNWFGLITESDLSKLSKKGVVDFTDAIELIEQRCRDRGSTLVLRDWAHLDYTGLPFATPTYQPLLFKALTGKFEIVRIAIARSPVTQWQSLINLKLMDPSLRSGAFGLDQFLAGYRRYAELCVETGFVRYEDLLRKPEIPIRRICQQLEIRYDPTFINKWFNYKTVTGDISNPQSTNTNKIRKLSDRPVDPDLRKRFLSNPDYHRACKLLGYDVLSNKA